MEREIIISKNAAEDFKNIIFYIKNNWQQKVLIDFIENVEGKYLLLKQQPNLGYKTSKYSRFRQTIIGKHYILIYKYSRKEIFIVRIKHSSQNR